MTHYGKRSGVATEEEAARMEDLRDIQIEAMRALTWCAEIDSTGAPES